MQKRVLIIGNSEGLPGVKVDIENYKGFFKSNCGGDWYDFEITTKLNASRNDVITELNLMKGLSLDYSIIIFSGHGGQKRETFFELNSAGETIYESEIKAISTRQLTIYDCCRAYAQPVNESRAFTALLNKGLADVNTRERYERRIMEAIPQEVNLYACSKGEKAYDTSAGGVYSKYLIQSARNLNTPFKSVGVCHDEAAILTTAAYRDQHPEAVLPRCLSSQQLILSINP